MKERSSLLVIATFKPWQQDALDYQRHALIVRSRVEAGWIHFDPHRSRRNPAVWIAYQNWRSQVGLEAHERAPYQMPFAAGKHELLEREWDIARHTM